MVRRKRGLRIERAYERSRLDEDLRAGAYEMVVPMRRVLLRQAKKNRALACG
jgi:hypothetical protein